MKSLPPRLRRAFVAVAAGLVLGIPLLATGTSAADTAPPTAVPTTVAADVLPTTQINGVVWAQLVVGNTVYVTGQFTSARPAGAPSGTGETPRSNILAYDLTSGNLRTDWAPTLDAQGLALAASSDGSTIFVAGDFTSVSGVPRARVAALDAATGAVRTTFDPGSDARVRALAVSGNTLFIGGIFTTVGGQARTRLAAISTVDGSVLPWSAAADDEVLALNVPRGTTKLVVGGRFTTLNGEADYGLGELDTLTASTLPFPTNAVVKDAGANAAIYSLQSDATQIYGTGYVYGAGGNLENSFASDIATGNLAWISGCHGDTYSGVPIGSVYYIVGHAHECSQIGAFPQGSPTWTYQRSIAYTTAPGANNKVNVSGNFVGRPAPDLLDWLPTLDIGTYTGQNQAAWSVTGNSSYVVLGGEFPSINGVPQQGLARFAVRSIAPNLEGPQGYTGATPTPTPVSAGTVRASWQAAWDRDNTRLVYELLRGPQLSTATVVGRTTFDNNWWTRPTMTMIDATAPPGTAQSYRVRVTDPLGNVMISTTTTVNVAAGSSSRYAATVRADGATALWRLGEASGTLAYDNVGTADLTLASGATRGAAGALAGDTDTATTFPGTATVPASTTGTAVAGPQTFSVEAWFKTTSTKGGKIIGFGDRSTAVSTNSDRHVYMTNAGKLVFGVYPGAARTVTSANAYNNGQWHHVVATLGSGGLALFVDGQSVGVLAGTTSAQVYNGYWHVGGDTIGGKWPTRPTNTAFAGTIDEAAVYPAALSAQTVQSHYQYGLGNFPNQNPTASFAATHVDLTASFDGTASTDPDGTVTSWAWSFGDGTTGTGSTVSHAYSSAGTYPVTLTVTDNRGGTGTTAQSVTTTNPPASGATIAADAFTRTLSAGWGTADSGGAWAISGAGTTATVDGSVGMLSVPPGKTETARLSAVVNRDSDVQHTVALDAVPTGGGAYVSTIVRGTAGGDYRARLRVLSTGDVQASITEVVGGTETALTNVVTVPGLTYTPGTVLQIRAQAVGSNPTTVQMKVWMAGGTEPSTWVCSTTDTTAALQTAGSVGVVGYLSSSATAAIGVRVDNLTVVTL